MSHLPREFIDEKATLDSPLGTKLRYDGADRVIAGSDSVNIQLDGYSVVSVFDGYTLLSDQFGNICMQFIPNAFEFSPGVELWKIGEQVTLFGIVQFQKEGIGSSSGSSFVIQSQDGQEQDGDNDNTNGGHIKLTLGRQGFGGGGADGLPGNLILTDFAAPDPSLIRLPHAGNWGISSGRILAAKKFDDNVTQTYLRIDDADLHVGDDQVGGDLILDVKAGQTPRIRVNNSDVLTLSPTNITFKLSTGPQTVLDITSSQIQIGAGVGTVQFNETSGTISLLQATRSGTGSNNGSSFVIAAQDGQNQSGINTNTNGGNLALRAGAGGTLGGGADGNGGNVQIVAGAGTNPSTDGTITVSSGTTNIVTIFKNNNPDGIILANPALDSLFLSANGTNQTLNLRATGSGGNVSIIANSDCGLESTTGDFFAGSDTGIATLYGQHTVITAGTVGIPFFTSGQINISAENNMDISGGGDVNVSGDGDINVTAGGDVNVGADGYDIAKFKAINYLGIVTFSALRFNSANYAEVGIDSVTGTGSGQVGKAIVLTAQSIGTEGVGAGVLEGTKGGATVLLGGNGGEGGDVQIQGGNAEVTDRKAGDVTITGGSFADINGTPTTPVIGSTGGSIYLNATTAFGGNDGKIHLRIGGTERFVADVTASYISDGSTHHLEWGTSGLTQSAPFGFIGGTVTSGLVRLLHPTASYSDKLIVSRTYADDFDHTIMSLDASDNITIGEAGRTNTILEYAGGVEIYPSQEFTLLVNAGDNGQLSITSAGALSVSGTYGGLFVDDSGHSVLSTSSDWSMVTTGDHIETRLFIQDTAGGGVTYLHNQAGANIIREDGAGVVTIGAASNIGAVNILANGDVSLKAGTAGAYNILSTSGGTEIDIGQDTNVATININCTGAFTTRAQTSASIQSPSIILREDTSNATLTFALNSGGASTQTIYTGVTSYTLSFADKTTSSGTGGSLTIAAQNETGTTSTGGALILQSGTGTSTTGALTLKAGTTTRFTANGTGVNIYASSAIAQQTKIANYTDSTGGTPGTTLAAVTGTTYSTDIPTIRNWIASLNKQINDLKNQLSAGGGGFAITT